MSRGCAPTRCEVAPIDNAKLTFLKQVYLAKGIDTTTGTMNFAVLVDGMLAGAFSYVLEKWGDKSSAVYLLSTSPRCASAASRS